MDVMEERDDWRGWLPIRVFADGDDWRVDWCWFGDTPLGEPFFSDSVRRALRLPFNQAMRRDSSLGALSQWREASPGVAPGLFIHHASRCGSTLLAQLLASDVRNIVLSEAPALDTLLREELPASVRSEGLRGLLNAYGQRLRGVEQALVVKLDAWNVHQASRLHRLYPATPSLFVYRDPLEILVSHLRQPGMHMVPGLLGASTPEPPGSLAGMDRMAQRIGEILQGGLSLCREWGALPVNYSELPGAAWQRLAPLLRVDEADRPRLQAVAGTDAKQPGMPFSPDGERKRAEADETARAAVERWAREPYETLEALRLA
ncbi:sulfotransferase family protein [Pseudomonas nicosulfuronedens]